MAKLPDYLKNRSKQDKELAKEIEQYEIEQNDFREDTKERLSQLEAENEMLNSTLDYVLTEIIPAMAESEV